MKEKNLPLDNETDTLEELTAQANDIIESLEKGLYRLQFYQTWFSFFFNDFFNFFISFFPYRSKIFMKFFFDNII